MEKGLVSFWIQLILTVIFFETGSCISCHSCISLHEEKCADPASWELKGMECTIGMVEDTYTNLRRALVGNFHMPLRSQEFQCFKINIIMKDYSKHNKTTIRGCQYARTDRYDPCREIRKNATEPAAIQFCETCYYNECNGSNRIRSSSLLTSLIVPFFAILFLIRQ